MKKFLAFLLFILLNPINANAAFMQNALGRVGGIALESDSADELANYDVIVLQRFHYDDINGDTWNEIKSINADVQIYLYQETFVRNDQDANATQYLNSIARWSDGDGDYGSRSHSMGDIYNDNNSFLLKNSSGSIIYFSTYTTQALIAFGDTDYQDYWYEATYTDLVGQAWTADGIFIDDAVLWNTGQPVGASSNTTYTTATAWNNAMIDFITTESYNLHSGATTQKTIVNSTGSVYAPRAAAWLTMDADVDHPDFILDEMCSISPYGTGDVYIFSEANWKIQIDTLLALTNCKVILSASVDTTMPEGDSGVDSVGNTVTYWQMLWYTMCSTHLAQKSTNHLYFDFGVASYSDVPTWYDEYDIDLGDPVGNYTYTYDSEGANIYYREFDNGWVIVNPTYTDVSSFTLPKEGQLINHSTISTYTTDATISTVALPKHTGVMIYTPNVDISGTITSQLSGEPLESAIKAGGLTAVFELEGDTFVSSFTNEIKAAIVAGMDSNQSETYGWDAVIKVDTDSWSSTGVVRDSDTQFTVTFPIASTYSITSNETITFTIPASALTGGEAIISDTEITIQNENPSETPVTGKAKKVLYSTSGGKISYDENGCFITVLSTPSSCTSDYCFDFEDGAPTNWYTSSETVNYAYTTSPAPINGSYSLGLTYDTNYAWVIFDPSFDASELYITFKVATSSELPSTSFFRFVSASGINIGSCYINGSSQWAVAPYGGTPGAGGDSTGTSTQTVKFYYKAESYEGAADGVMTVWEYIDSSWVQAATSTDNPNFETVDRIAWYVNTEGTYLVIDDIKIDTADIVTP